MEEGKKFDTGKIKYSLIPPIATKRLAEVLTFAIEKKGYVKNSWKTVPEAEERYLDALMRHIEDYRAGIKIDPESGINAMAHVMANASFLIYFDEAKKEGGDV